MPVPVNSGLPRAVVAGEPVPVLAASWPADLGGSTFEPALPVQWNVRATHNFEVAIDSSLEPWALILQRFISVGSDGAPEETDADTIQCTDDSDSSVIMEPSCHYRTTADGVQVTVSAQDFRFVVLATNWISPEQSDLEIANAPFAAWGFAMKEG
jgi:hypothetical protein